MRKPRRGRAVPGIRQALRQGCLVVCRFICSAQRTCEDQEVVDAAERWTFLLQQRAAWPVRMCRS